MVGVFNSNQIADSATIHFSGAKRGVTMRRALTRIFIDLTRPAARRDR